MASIYNITFSTVWSQLSPPSKRSTGFLKWGLSLLKPLQWLRDLFFTKYATGSTYTLWSNVTAYVKGDRVQYQAKVYEAYLPNTGEVPTGSSWILVLEDFRGAYERVTYNGQKLTLEWILNRWFATTFVQPVHATPSARSDFYIDTLDTDDNTMLVGVTAGKSFVKTNSAYMIDFVKVSYTAQANNIQINYPLSVISATTTNEYKEMVSLVEKYKLYGTTPVYVGY